MALARIPDGLATFPLPLGRFWWWAISLSICRRIGFDPYRMRTQGSPSPSWTHNFLGVRCRKATRREPAILPADGGSHGLR